MNRKERRNLERRADRVLRELRGYPIVTDADVTPKTHVVVAGEGTTPGIVRREHVVPALALVGMHVAGIDELLAEIASSPQDDGRRFPVLIMVDGWLQCAWMEMRALTPGGAA